MEGLAWIFCGSVVGFCLCLAVLRCPANAESDASKGIRQDEGECGEEVMCRYKCLRKLKETYIMGDA